MRTAVAISALSTSFVLAVAADGPNDPKFIPDVVLVDLVLNTPMTNTTMFDVPATAAPMTIGAIQPLNCPPNISASPSSFMIGSGGGQQSVSIFCPASATYGIERCQLEARSNPGSIPVATVTALCITAEHSSIFGASKGDLQFFDVPIGGTSTQEFFVLTSPDNMTTLSLEVGDNDGNFVIDEPCTPTGVKGCDVTITPNTNLMVRARCTPQTAGPHTGQLQIVEHITGRRTSPGITLSCSTMATDDRDIDVNPPTLNHSLPVGDTIGDMIGVMNTSATQSLVISSINISTPPDWDITLPGNCPQSGCTLGPGQSFMIGTVFQPMSVNSNLDATITINSDDPDEASFVISLFGEGTAGNGQDIFVDPPSVTKMVPVNDMQTEFITVMNAGTIDSLVISSIVPSSSPHWTITVPAACQSGCTLVPTESITLEAEFHPSIVASNLDATITINSNDPDEDPVVVNLFGTGLGGTQDIDASPPQLMRIEPVNSSTGDMITISNQSPTDSLVISNIQAINTSHWSIALPTTCPAAGCTLGPGASFDISTTFHPMVEGSNLNTTITIASDDPDEASLVIDLFGTGLADGAPDIDASPSPLTVTIPANTQEMNPVTITNTSATDTLMISSIVPINTTHWTVIVPGSCSAGCSLGPGGTLALATTFHPTIAGSHNTTITIMSNDADENPLVVNLNGTATDADGLIATPPSIDLGNVRLDRPSSGSTNLSLAGSNSITIDSVTFTAGTTMTNGSLVTTSQEVNLIVSMVAPNEGAFSTTATVNGTITGGGTTALPIPVTGTGVRAEAMVPAMIDAGSFCIGQPANPVEVTLTSSGTATFDMVGKPTLTTGAAFAVSYTSPLESEYPRALAPSETARVAVSIKMPGTVGDHMDTLVWDTDLATDPTTTIRAKLIDDGGAISPQLIDFENQQLRLASAPRTITLQNCGTASLALDGLEIDPSDEFRTSTTLPAQLAPLETTTVLVDFTPRVAGLRTATLTIDSSMGPLEVQLAGTGIAGNINSGDPESFYACSCRSNDPRGFFVIVVALGCLLLRPRRRLRYARP